LRTAEPFGAYFLHLLGLLASMKGGPCGPPNLLDAGDAAEKYGGLNEGRSLRTAELTIPAKWVGFVNGSLNEGRSLRTAERVSSSVRTWPGVTPQ